MKHTLSYIAPVAKFLLIFVTVGFVLTFSERKILPLFIFVFLLWFFFIKS